MIDFEIADIKKENIELKGLNKQYFENIIDLSKDVARLKLLIVAEFCLFVIILISINNII